MEFIQLIGIFITGLLAGGLSCMAVQGGLLAATIAQQEEKRLQKRSGTDTIMPISIFLLAKLAAYTMLGFLLGWFGSLFQLSLSFQVALQFLVGIFLVGTALHLLNAHPLFRYFVIQPPHWATRAIRRETKSNAIFAPALLGASTVLIPCGATQAAMAISIASSNPFTGALILFAFTLGTLPVFFILGYLASRVGVYVRQAFTRVAAIALLVLAIFALNNGIALTGSHYTIESLAMGGWCFISFCDGQDGIPPPTDDANITIDAYGYNPRQLTVHASAPVNIHLTNTGNTGCPQAFTIPQLGLQQVVPLGTSKTVHFTAPSQPEQIAFMCSAGMYRGVINVI